MAEIDDVSLGNVQTETQSKSSNLFLQPLPYSDSSESILLDIFGCQRDISIDGIITGSVTELRDFVNAIEAIQDGKQSGSSYVGDLITTSKNVFINTFRWTYEKANINSLSYTLDLIEGADIGGA